MFPTRWLLLSGSLLTLAGCGQDVAKQTAPSQPPPLAIASNRSTLEVVAGDGQLGTADFGEQRQCTYTLRNNSAQGMRLRVTDKSCSCSGAKLEPEVIGPGQTCLVTLLWTPKVEVLETSTTRMWTEIRDQDGSGVVRLEGNGTLEPKVRFAFPRGPLDFGRLDLAELNNPARTLVVEAYSVRENFQMKRLSAVPDGVQVVDNPEPMTADRLTQLQARTGYRITLKPTRGLPTGQFLGHLHVETSLSPVTLMVPLSGAFETGVISLSSERVEFPPRLDLRQGYRVPPLTLTVRQGTCSSCEVVALTPPLFQHKVTKLNEKTWRIELNLPPGLSGEQTNLAQSRWNDLLSFGFEHGLVTLKLDHPEVKTVQIPISGAQLMR
jgi:hypothetical protein